ncbi:maleylpyruvate isomerase family mycothiol-dependent enzyme [Actinacidiphila bryophytorum]|uniref:Maleylpyruvate isomerase family mycothiol-dependent enzyme n=1 Tax=Actinacidiphila bryophytorum TaxID=1436133 RepID=A0A9W4H5M9_9ACTN|nr:maleylpyruvate isomerase family mycothiol-dependent enzyme [Actinacidiphila bryophytorum]MBM9440843.1 maleylpyruvate isomerase family mycothiol-dependent enzyme [Actinacidiphila bryophytorum]MBN6546321.1 maleylpyruvate isomerase family mycothiol-dependent enzyme [Actinacidiphila bryophytorum]CAG7652357.1 conserved hypothetical protein [Actinacidiphila bryophytorum]
MDAFLSRETGLVADRIADLVRTAPDTRTPIPGAEWTVGEAAAHLVLANELMADLARGRQRPYGEPTPAGLAAANAAGLAAFTERDGATLAQGIVEHARAFTAAAAARADSEPVATPMGPMDLGTLGAYLLTHMLGHGYDIAVALRRPHMLTAANVALTLPFVTLAMPRVVDARAAAGHTACYGLRLRGGPGFTVTFTGGAVEVEEGRTRRPDCTIVAEPVTFLLIALGRRGPVAAMSRGKILCWGRKPWLAPRFPGLFRAP